MAKPMSYVAAVEAAINGNMTEEVKERLVALKASLEKRSASKSGKPTKAQEANAALAEAVYEAMTAGEVYDTKGIKALVPELADANPQKIAPLMKHLGDRVTCDKVKGKNVYRLA